MRPVSVLLLATTPSTRRQWRALLEGRGWCIRECGTLSGRRIDGPADLIITDQLSNYFSDFDTSVPLILSSGGLSQTEFSAFRAGMGRFVQIPLESKTMTEAIDELGVPHAAERNCDPFDRFVGGSEPAARIREILHRLAPAACNVLITGETGTGKELVAELIHQNSDRASQAMICVNCAAIPESLVESELFGFERGAFTGAVAAVQGKLEQANGGTIFFDEIGDMPLLAQAKVLRAIESRTIYRLGGRRPIPLDLRVLAATNSDLDRLASTGEFRKDLYYRLNVARVDVPPLRQRRDDIRELLDHSVAEFASSFGRETKGFTPEVVERLAAYDWPGNVRELRNLVESSFVYSSANEFSWADLPPHFQTIWHGSALIPTEKQRLLAALDDTRWNKSLAASRLGWSRMTLYRKMARYHVTPRPRES